MKNKVFALLGFAQKSGCLYSGETSVKTALRIGKAKLILIAEDLPMKKKAHLIHECYKLGINYYISGSKSEYGEILGMPDRGIIAVTDKQMSIAIINIFNNNDLIE